MNGQTICVGDHVQIPSDIFSEKSAIEKVWIRGTLVWIHPLKRFCVVELQLRGGIVRECCKYEDIRKIKNRK